MAYPWLSRGHVRPPGQKGEKYSVSRGSATIVMLEEEGSNQGKTTVRLIRWTNLHAQKVTMRLCILAVRFCMCMRTCMLSLSRNTETYYKKKKT